MPTFRNEKTISLPHQSISISPYRLIKTHTACDTDRLTVEPTSPSLGEQAIGLNGDGDDGSDMRNDNNRQSGKDLLSSIQPALDMSLDSLGEGGGRGGQGVTRRQQQQGMQKCLHY